MSLTAVTAFVLAAGAALRNRQAKTRADLVAAVRAVGAKWG